MKKKINRRDFLKVMGVVGMTASLAACGDSGSSSAAASSTAGGDDGVITISYWTTDRHDQAYLTPLIEEYNKTNSDNICSEPFCGRNVFHCVLHPPGSDQCRGGAFADP